MYYIIMLVSLIFPKIILASGKELEPIVIVADTRKLTGITAWFATLYNESHFWFTVVTIIIIPVIGVTLGFLADFVMSYIGIDLTSRDLAEH